jgi:hypothetical protein
MVTCTELHQLAVKTAWKIMVPSFPKKPPKECLEFAIQKGRQSNLPPLLVSPEFKNRCPNDFQIDAAIIAPDNLISYSYFEKLNSMVIYSSLNVHSLQLGSTPDVLAQLAEDHAELVRKPFEEVPKDFKSLMLKSIHISPGTLECLNILPTEELHLKLCSFDISLMNSYRDNFDFNSLTQLHVEVEGIFSINSRYMFKSLKKLVIHLYCPRSSLFSQEEAHLHIRADDFKYLEHL